MSPSFTKKSDGRRYPCYVSQAILQNRRHTAGSVPRIPAEPIEKAVCEYAKPLCTKHTAAIGSGPVGLNATLRETVDRVVLSKDGIEIVGINSAKTLKVAGVMVRRGRALAFEQFGSNYSRTGGKPSAALMRAVCRASSWLERCESGEIRSYYQLARAEGLAPSYVRSNMQLAFLAPDLVEALFDNRNILCGGVVKLTSQRLPLSWHKQLALLKSL